MRMRYINSLLTLTLITLTLSIYLLIYLDDRNMSATNVKGSLALIVQCLPAHQGSV